LAVDDLVPLEDRLDPLHVGAGLVAREDVIDSPEVVRARNHLEAAVLARRLIDRDARAHEERSKDAVLIPVAVVLVPGPRPAHARILHDHLRVIVIDLAFEDRLRRADELLAPREHPIDPLAGMVPERETDGAALTVGLAVG